MKSRIFLLASAILVGFLSSAGARDVVIVTSFPKELFETYKKTFEAKHPGTTVVINSKPTPAGVTFLRETKAKPEADIFWVSAPDAFQTLDSDGLLENTRRRRGHGEDSAKVGNFPIHDPGKVFWLRHQQLWIDVE
jgi:ABC-type glycerol-3-phosphate transport system substrate-binding protein